MRLTRRGWGALAVVGLAYAAAYLSGARALNAIVAPVLAALAAGAILVARADPPTVTYGSLRSGYPGQTRTLTVDVDGGGIVRLAQSLPNGLAAADLDVTVTPPHTIERTLTFANRGVYRLDPPFVRQRDPMGLVGKRVEAAVDLDFVVYPTVYDLDETHLSHLFSDELAAERQEFDRLREYVPGDPLKNVHWKSSAKYDDFLVMEFSPSQRTETVHIVADADPGGADAMATAAATLALGALDAGLGVELTVPGEDVASGQGEAHRENLLRVLAGASAGTVPDAVQQEADVSVHADGTGTRVRYGDQSKSFTDLLGTTGQRVGGVAA
jgi:uncharacterized protein (DUF58 family)